MKNHPTSGPNKDLTTVTSPEAFFAPSLFQTLFWKPRFLPDGAIVSHLPFLFWLSVVLKPLRVVVVGCDDGTAHFAICQALEKMGHDSQCRGFGFWNDAKTGKRLDAPPKTLELHQAMLYEEMSCFIPCLSLEDAIESLGEGTVDLMLVDLTVVPSDLHVSGETLASSLSKRGVLVLHGINDLSKRAADGRSLERFLRATRNVRFSAEQGLGVIVKDDEPPAPLNSLLEYAPDGMLRGDIERVFRRCGQNLRSSASASVIRPKLDDANNALKTLRRELEAAKEEITSVRRSNEFRSQKLAEAQVELFERNAEISRLNDELAAERQETALRASEIESTVKQIQALQADLAKVEAELLTAHETVAERERDNADLLSLLENSESRTRALQSEAEELFETVELERASYRSEVDALRVKVKETEGERDRERNIRFEETAALTRLNEELRAKFETVELERASHRSEVDLLRVKVKEAEAERLEADKNLSLERGTRFNETAALTGIAEELRTELGKVEAERVKTLSEKADLQRWIDELHRSTSWRVTAPMRFLKGTLDRKSN